MPTGYNTYVLNKNNTHTPLPRFMKCSALKLHFMELLSKVLDKIYGSKERTWVWLKKEQKKYKKVKIEALQKIIQPCQYEVCQ